MRFWNRTRAPFLVTALLVSAGLAACSDTPTGALVPVADAPPVFYTAPQPTVTSSGGHPLISWPAVAGATGYTVRYFYIHVTHMYDGNEEYRGETYFPVGTTAATSISDTVLSYTGSPQCWFPNYTTGFEILTYQYEVTAHFAGGSSTGYAYAPVGPC